MYRLTEDRRMSRRIGLSLLGLCLLVCLSATARADSDGQLMGMQDQYLNSGGRSADNGPVLICGGQSHRGTSLLIRGTDVAALWRSAYRMLSPRSALADDTASVPVAKKIPHKGPEWGINLSHGDAYLTVQTKW